MSEHGHVTFSVRLPRVLVDRIEAVALREQRSRNKVIEIALHQAMRDQEGRLPQREKSREAGSGVGNVEALKDSLRVTLTSPPGSARDRKVAELRKAIAEKEGGR